MDPRSDQCKGVNFLRLFAVAISHSRHMAGQRVLSNQKSRMAEARLPKFFAALDLTKWNCCRRALLDFLQLQLQNPGMPDENSQRIDKLESHLAHLEHQVEQLNGVVIEQGKLLDRLKKEVQRQSGFMQTLELERMKSNLQKPPHYQ